LATADLLGTSDSRAGAPEDKWPPSFEAFFAIVDFESGMPVEKIAEVQNR
jgi:hypothetical protein